MTTLSEHSCSLCLGSETDEKFEIIDDFTRDILSVLSPKLRFDKSKTQAICSACNGKLKAALEFKSSCLATGDTLFPYIDGKEELQLDLREIYMKEFTNEHGVNLPSEIKICSLCMRLVRDEFLVVRDEEVNIIHKFVPEMNMDVIKDPVVCKCCFASLNTHSSFLSYCLEIHKRIGATCHTIATNQSDDQTFQEKHQNRSQDVVENCSANLESGPMDLKAPSHLEMYPLVYSVASYDQIPNVWILGHTLEIQPQALKHKDLESHDLKQGTFGQVYDCTRIFKCEECKYRSRNEWCFQQHQLKHKEDREAQLYKCDECKYQSKIKQDLYKHLLWHQKCKENRIYKCKKCEFQSTIRKNLCRHDMLHRGLFQMYKCASCDYQSTVRVSYLQHLRRHKKCQERPMYKCDKCEYQTNIEHNLNRHQLKHEKRKEKQIYKCKKCEYQSTIHINFRRHQVKHKEKQVYNCKECKYQSTSKGSFKQHKSRHKEYKGTQMYKCDKCKYQTKIWRYFYRHISRHEERKDA